MVSGRNRCRAGPCGCYWRKDGEPIWRNPDLVDAVGRTVETELEKAPGTAAVVFTDDQRGKAEALTRGIADFLGVDDECVMPAYEDPATWLVKEGNLPDNVDPLIRKSRTPKSATA